MIERVLCKREKDYLQNSLNVQKDFAFLWSRKEACFKRAGCGITEMMPEINTLDRTDITSFLFDKYVVSVCCASEAVGEIERIGRL